MDTKVSPHPTIKYPNVSNSSAENARLDDFLNEHRNEGRQDSEGVFTMDAKKAERKLAAFQLPTSESWLLVLVQAAHRGGAREIKVTQSSRQTRVVISGAQQWTWAGLEDVFQGKSTTDDALLAIAVVVRALRGSEELTSFRVKAPDGTSATWRNDAYKIERGRIEDVLWENDAVFEVNHLGEFPEKKSYFLENRRCARKQLVALHQALNRNCFASSVPLLIDGYSVPGFHLGDILPPFHHRLPLALLPFEDYRVPSIPMTAAMKSAQAVMLKNKEGLDPKNPLGALACLTLTFERPQSILGSGPPRLAETPCPSRLVWIQDGVVVGSHSLEIPGSLELTLILSGAGLKTDLTGLELVKSKELQQRKTMISESFGQTLLELSKTLQDKLKKGEGDIFGLTRLSRGEPENSVLSAFASFWRKKDLRALSDQKEKLLYDLEQLPDRFVAAYD